MRVQTCLKSFAKATSKRFEESKCVLVGKDGHIYKKYASEKTGNVSAQRGSAGNHGVWSINAEQPVKAFHVERGTSQVFLGALRCMAKKICGNQTLMFSGDQNLINHIDALHTKNSGDKAQEIFKSLKKLR